MVENGKLINTVLLIRWRINDIEGKNGNFEVWEGGSNTKASIKLLIA